MSRNSAQTRRIGRAQRKRAPTAFDEVTDTLHREVTRCAARSSEQAGLIESTGTLALDTTIEIHRGSSSSELHRYVAAMRSLASQGVQACVELHREAGRLEMLGDILEVTEGAVHEIAQDLDELEGMS